MSHQLLMHFLHFCFSNGGLPLPLPLEYETCYLEIGQVLCDYEILWNELLGYVMKACLHTHKGAQRDNGRWGTPNHTLPSYSQTHHRSHQPIKCPSPQGQGRRRESQKQMGTQVKDSKGEMAFLEPPRTVSGEPQPLCPSMRPIKIQQCQGTFGTEGADAWGVGHIMGCRGNVFQDCARHTLRKWRGKEIKRVGCV